MRVAVATKRQHRAGLAVRLDLGVEPDLAGAALHLVDVVPRLLRKRIQVPPELDDIAVAIVPIIEKREIVDDFLDRHGWFVSGAWCRRCYCVCKTRGASRARTSYRHIGAAPLAVQAMLRCPKKASARPGWDAPGQGRSLDLSGSGRTLVGSGGALCLRLLARRRSTPGRRKVGWRQRMLRRPPDGSPSVRRARLSPPMLREHAVEQFGSPPGL